MQNLFKKLNRPSSFIITSFGIILIAFISFLIIIEWNNYPVNNERKIYYVDNISIAHRHVIDRFNQLNKGKIKVEVINLSFEKFSTNERKELLARYLRSKNDKIDVFAADQIWAHRFARWAEPLDKYFTEDDNLKLSFTVVYLQRPISSGTFFYRYSRNVLQKRFAGKIT